MGTLILKFPRKCSNTNIRNNTGKSLALKMEKEEKKGFAPLVKEDEGPQRMKVSM